MEKRTRVKIVNNYDAPIYVGVKRSEMLDVVNPGRYAMYDTLRDSDRLVAKSAPRAQLYELEIDLRDYNFVEVEAYNNRGELDFRITDEVSEQEEMDVEYFPEAEAYVTGGGTRYELFY